MSVIIVVNWLIKKNVFLQSLIHEYCNNIYEGNNMVYIISYLCGKHMVKKNQMINSGCPEYLVLPIFIHI